MIETEKPITTTAPRSIAAQVLWSAISWQEVKPSASGTTQVPVSKNDNNSAPSPTSATVASIAAESFRTVVLMNSLGGLFLVFSFGHFFLNLGTNLVHIQILYGLDNLV